MLYKICLRRDNLVFEPSRFWRNADWTSSSTNPKPGYVEENVLYAAEFDEVNIHILPKVRRLRVWNSAENYPTLNALGYSVSTDSKATLFARERDRAAVIGSSATVYVFDREGFTAIPSNEYVARSPKRAIQCETISVPAALERWNVDLRFVADLDQVIALLKERGVRYGEQT